jgi:hypothetical protein
MNNMVPIKLRPMPEAEIMMKSHPLPDSVADVSAATIDSLILQIPTRIADTNKRLEHTLMKEQWDGLKGNEKTH